MMGTASNSWLMRTASVFAQIERSIKAVPVQPGALYPPPRQSSTGWISWQGWDQFEKQAQTDAERDKQNAKTAVTSPWVFADVQAIANEFSTAELVVKERKATKLENVDNHELELLWESPNEHMGRSFVSSFWAWSYVLASKAYLYWVPDTTGTSIQEVWPVPPWMIRPIPDPKEFISGYVFRSSSDAEPRYIAPEYITYSHSVNLFNAHDGLAFLVAAMTEINADLAASMWNLNFFDDNNGLPDGFLGVSQDTLDVDLERIRMEIKDFFGGSKRGVAVGRTNDLKYTQFGRSQKDMEFSQGREFASKIIGRTLGFPDGYWSDLANRANAEQARKTMISGAVWPLLVRLAEDMNAKKRGIVQHWYGEDFRVEFKDIRPEDRELKLRELQTYSTFMPIKRLLEFVGEEPLDDIRDDMLVAEINKGAPTPGSKPALDLEDEQAAKDEQAAQEQAAAIEAGAVPAPKEEAPSEEALPPAEPAPEEGAIVPMKAIENFNLTLNLPQQPEMRFNAVMPSQPTPDVTVNIEPAKVVVEPTDVTVNAIIAPDPAEGDPLTEADDLRRWEAKATKQFKKHGRADVTFKSDVISDETCTRISAALKAVQSMDDVKRAFKGDALDALDALLDDVDDDARAWAGEAVGK